MSTLVWKLIGAGVLAGLIVLLWYRGEAANSRAALAEQKMAVAVTANAGWAALEHRTETLFDEMRARAAELEKRQAELAETQKIHAGSVRANAQNKTPLPAATRRSLELLLGQQRPAGDDAAGGQVPGAAVGGQPPR